jgi:hypothetical protein
MEAASTPTFGDDDLFGIAPDEELGGLSVQNHRLARIAEFEEDALARPNPYAAVIGFGCADLQRVLGHYSKALLQQLESREHTWEEIRELEPTVRLLLKLQAAVALDLAVDSETNERPPSKARKSRKPKGISLRAKPNGRERLPKH